MEVLRAACLIVLDQEMSTERSSQNELYTCSLVLEMVKLFTWVWVQLALSLVDKCSDGITNSYVSHITTWEKKGNLWNYLALLCVEISISLLIWAFDLGDSSYSIWKLILLISQYPQWLLLLLFMWWYFLLSFFSCTLKAEASSTCYGILSRPFPMWKHLNYPNAEL